MAINKKLRFEVFKRDSFTCQYCGRTPPEIKLEVDHIIPISQNGKQIIDNLITACFDCNRGKGKNDLKVAPMSIKDNLKEHKERQQQLLEYTKFITERENRLQIEIEIINNLFTKYYPKRIFTESFKMSTIKSFLNKLPKQKILDALSLASGKFTCDKNTTEEDIDALASKAVPYFCGICWNWIKRPETRDW